MSASGLRKEEWLEKTNNQTISTKTFCYATVERHAFHLREIWRHHTEKCVRADLPSLPDFALGIAEPKRVIKDHLLIVKSKLYDYIAVAFIC